MEDLKDLAVKFNNLSKSYEQLFKQNKEMDKFISLLSEKSEFDCRFCMFDSNDGVCDLDCNKGFMDWKTKKLKERN